MFEAFAESDYRRFWGAMFVSNIGSWMQGVAQGWLVYRLTDSPFLLGFVGFAGSAPMIFLMLPGGVVADHFDRKRVVAASQIVQALCALWLAVAIRLDVISIWHIVGAALMVGVAQSFSAPAYQAMVVDLLEDRSRLTNAVAMNSLQFNLSRAVGPLLAGVTLSLYGSFWCFLINALSFLPLIRVLYSIRDRQLPLESTTPLSRRMVEGLAFVWRQRILLLLVAMVAAMSLFGYPLLTLMPMLARKLFHNDASGLGYLTAAVGVGALGAALFLSMSMPEAKRVLRLIVLSVGGCGAVLVVVAFSSSPALVIPMLVIYGVGMVVSLVLCNASIQQGVPDAMRGRVMSIYTLSFFAFLPIGNLGAGVLAERWGIAVTLAALSGGLLVSAAGVALTSGSGR